MTDPTRVYPLALPTLPNGAAGFLANRPDRAGHVALYSAGGVLLVTFSYRATLPEATAAILAAYPGARIDGPTVYGLPDTTTQES